MHTSIQNFFEAATYTKKVRVRAQQARPSHKPVTLVYLSHLNCDACHQTVKELRQIATADPNYPSVVFIHSGSSGDGDVIRNLWSEAPVVADRSGYIYQNLIWSEEAFGQCLALTGRLDTAEAYADVLKKFWLLPQAV